MLHALLFWSKKRPTLLIFFVFGYTVYCILLDIREKYVLNNYMKITKFHK